MFVTKEYVFVSRRSLQALDGMGNRACAAVHNTVEVEEKRVVPVRYRYGRSASPHVHQSH